MSEKFVLLLSSFFCSLLPLTRQKRIVKVIVLFLLSGMVPERG